jgi:hypothetical protein
MLEQIQRLSGIEQPFQPSTGGGCSKLRAGAPSAKLHLLIV